jgi:hypothetical protein
MEFLHFIGIDVSKNWFDVALDASAGKARRSFAPLSRII